MYLSLAKITKKLDKDFILVIPIHKQISKGVLNQVVQDLGLAVEKSLKQIRSSNNIG